MWSVLLGLIGLVAVTRAGLYSAKLDALDVHDVINNKRLLQGYIKCVLGKASCTSEGKELKANLKQALETRCDQCSDVHKEKLALVVGHIINEEEEYWKELVAVYDPEMKYSKLYEDDLKILKKSSTSLQ
uniref:Chemosensory protein n=1 Tax=Histia rhodope TaxID=1453155 RepID=A0A6M9BJY4_9NEOP|nr:chemosensory protein [Histia rhodope]